MNFNIDYRYLKAFQKTAKYLNFSKAAQELNIAQSAISRQIKLLEDGMGEQLIIRSSKKVLLTEKGKALLAAVQSFEETTLSITKNDGKKLIRIGILHGLLETWFIGIIKEYVKKTKHELEIIVETPQNLKRNLVEGKLDIIFTNENIQNDLVTSLGLFDEKLVLISKKEIDLKKIQQYPWIIYGESDFFYAQYKSHSEQVITVRSMTSIIKLVKENVGIAIVPDHTIKKEDRLIVTPIKSTKKHKIHLSTLSFTSYPPHLNELIKIIKSHKN